MASEKKIDPSLKLISEYLRISEDTKFVIPEYQRAYKWEYDVQCDKLWEDITAYMHEDGKDPYFFGTVIIDASIDGELRLIDGQQRTTTFVLLMKALLVRIEEVIPQMAEDEDSRGIKEDLDKYRRIIIECLYKKDDEDDVRKIIKDWTSVLGIEYIKNYSINEEQEYKNDITKILQGRTYDDIECNVHRIPRRQKDNKYTNFFRNFKFFYQRITKELSDSTSLRLFAKTFLKRCQIIEIKSWQTEQAIMMFNSLNSTGMPLSDADIISAQLSATAGGERDEFNKEWNRFIQVTSRLENARIVDTSTILQQYMYIKIAEETEVDSTRKASVTTEAMRKFYMGSHQDLMNDPLAFCSHLNKLAEIWDKIRDYPIVKVALKFNMNIKAFMAAYLYRFNVGEISEEKVRGVTESLIRLFAILELVPDGYSSSRFKIFLFTERLKLVRKEYSLEEIIRDIDAHIKDNWAEGDIREKIENYERNNLVYLNEYLFAKQNGCGLPISPTTQVEHIMPQSGHNIKTIRENAEMVDDDEFKYYVNKIGNKFLLEEKKNKTIGNDWFVSKKNNEDGYRSSEFGMAREMAKYPNEKWTKGDITKFTTEAAERLTAFIYNK